MKATVRALTTINEGGEYHYTFDVFTLDAARERIDALVGAKMVELISTDEDTPAVEHKTAAKKRGG